MAVRRGGITEISLTRLSVSYIWDDDEGVGKYEERVVRAEGLTGMAGCR